MGRPRYASIIHHPKADLILCLFVAMLFGFVVSSTQRTRSHCLFFVSFFLRYWTIAGVAFTWFIFGALTDDIKQSLGLYWDPDAVVNKVEMERTKRLEAREALKPEKAAKDDDDEEENDDDEEEDEEEVTAETVAAAVAKAVEAAGDDDEDDDDGEAPDDEDEEEEEAPKPKKTKVDVDTLSDTEKWDYYASKMVEPGEDDDDDDDDDDDVRKNAAGNESRIRPRTRDSNIALTQLILHLLLF